MSRKRAITRNDASRPAREKILDAAKELFAARGFDKTTTKLVSEEAGVPSGLIFYYFENKQGLLETLLDERSFLPRLRQLLESVSEGDPRAALAEAGAKFFEFLRQEEDLVRIIFGEFHLHGVVYEHTQRLFEEAMGLASSHLQRAIDEGWISPSLDVPVASRIFVSTIIFGAAFKPPEDPETMVRQTVDILLRRVDI